MSISAALKCIFCRSATAVGSNRMRVTSHSIATKRYLSINPRDLKRLDRQKYTVFIGPALFCLLMYVCYFKEYEDKQSVAEYLKSDQLKEDAKRAYGLNKNNR